VGVGARGYADRAASDEALVAARSAGNQRAGDDVLIVAGLAA